jgi:hypothetical protein
MVVWRQLLVAGALVCGSAAVNALQIDSTLPRHACVAPRIRLHRTNEDVSAMRLFWFLCRLP